MDAIEIPGEGVSVTATCPRCECPLSRPGGSVSWACNTYGCGVRQVPMWEDARFVDDAGQVWVPTDGGGWVPVLGDG